MIGLDRYDVAGTPIVPTTPQANHHSGGSDGHPFGQDAQATTRNNINKKHGRAIRIAALNVGRIPIKLDNEKTKDLFAWIREIKADIILLSEIGINWRNIHMDSNWHSRTKNEFQRISSSLSFNIHEKSKKPTLWGGTAIIAIGNVASRVIQKGSDKSGMGRWSWLLLQGRENLVVRIISVYSPSKYSKGPFSVWQQQRTRLIELGVDKDPIDIWIEDLRTSLREWKKNGESIIIGGDINQNILSSPLQIMLSEEGIMERITPNQKHKIETQISNKSKIAIDSIWASANLVSTTSGFSKYDRWDHRTAWCDFYEAQIFGEERLPTPSFSGRRLILNRPLTVKKYLQEYKSIFANKNLFNRISELRQSIGQSTELSPAQVNALERIDEERSAAMLLAERRCRKVNANKVPFSPAVELARAKQRFWNLATKRRLGGKVNPRYLKRMKRKAQITARTNLLTIDDIKRFANKARKQYLGLKKKALTYRKSFLEERAAELAVVGKTSVEKAIRDIKKREEQKEVFAKIKYALGKVTGSKGIALVIGNNVNNERETFTTELKIAKCCMDMNKDKYSQAHNSRLCNSRSIHTFGKYGTKKTMKDIKERLINRQDVITRDFLQAVIPSEHHQWYPDKTRITLESHIEGWKKANEKTSSSPSGLHFGLWKANCRDKDLATADATLREIPLRTGYVLERWKHGVDVELPKIEGNFNVEKLRTICLFEADHNMNNKYIGKTAIAHAELLKRIPHEQYGSRKGRRATEVSLNNRLTDDLMRLNGQRGAICSNDAKSCYDRISHIALSLALQSQGVPAKVVEGMLKTIQQMNHSIKTAFGISKISYCSDRRGLPLQGMPQGHGAAPTGWALLSSPLIDAMRSKGFGFKMNSSIKNTEINFVCFSFVDDTDLVHTFEDDEDFDKMQEVVSTWEQNLATTGGAIVPEKSYWYPIDFVWRKGEWRYKKADDIKTNLYIPDPTSKEMKILEKLDVHTARKALGIMVRHDGVQADNAKFLRERATKWALNVNSKKLKPKEALIALKCTIWRSLCYPLAATTMNARQCNYAISPAIQAALPVIGLQRNISKTILHSSHHDLGLAIPNLFYEQLAAHIDAIFRHWNSGTTTGKLLRATVESIWVETGNSFWYREPIAIWSTVIRNNWMIETVKQAREANLLIEPPACPFQRQRDGDILIMDGVLKWTQNVDIIRIINNCRKFLQAIWLSDLVEQDGVTWRTGILEGVFPSDNWSNINWPKVGKITKRNWNKWGIAMRSIFSTSQDSTKISNNLGALRNTGHKQYWIRYNDQEEIAYTRENQGWRTWTRSNHSTRSHKFIMSNLGELPPGTNIASGYFRRRTLTITSFAKLTPNNLAGQTFEEICESAGPDLEWAVGRTIVTGNKEYIKTTIEAGDSIIVCDGSVKNNYGTAAFTIQEEYAKSRNYIRGLVTTPQSENMQSHRAELSGVYAALKALQLFMEAEGIRAEQLRLACDNKSVLRIFKSHSIINAKDPDADLLFATMNLYRDMRIKVIPEHVKGHQDNSSETRELSEIAQLNVKMDFFAKKYWDIAHTNGIFHTSSRRIPDEQWRVWTGANKITSFESKELSRKIFSSEIHKLWEKRKRILPNTSHLIDWKSMGTVYRKLEDNKKILTTKLLSGEYGTNQRMRQRCQQSNDKCPRCGAEENSNHLWVCQSITSQQIWEEELARFEKALRSFPTDRRLMKLLITNLTKHSRNLAPYTNESFGNKYHKMFQEQSKIGWDSLSKGFIHRGWSRIQEDFLRNRKSKRDSNQWSAKVVRKVWMIAWRQWEDRNKIKHERSNNNNPMEETLERMNEFIIQKAREEEWTNMNDIENVGLSSLNHKKAWLNHMIRRLKIRESDELPISDFEWKVLTRWRHE